MSDYFYIDTCSLKWRYINGAPTPTVNSIMDDINNQAFTSELTILEWSSALGSVLREGRIEYQAYKNNELALMTDIAEEKIKILPMSRNIEKARYLIEYIGIVKKRALNTLDAIQLVTAMQVASSARNIVTFVTSDHKLSRIVDDIEPLRPFLTSQYLPPS